MDEWQDLTVDDLKAPTVNALATGPFGSSISSRYFQQTGVPVIRGSNLSTDGRTLLIENEYVFVSHSKAVELQRATARKGDLIFTCWGTINQVGMISDGAAYERYIVSNKQMKLTPDPRKADSQFLFYLFSSSELQRKILQQSIGSSIPGFNLGQLRSLRLRVPPLAEQRTIAAALSDVDGLIAALDKLIAKKRGIKLATLHQLITGKTRLPGFVAGWKSLNMVEDSVLKARIGWQGLTTAEYLETGKYLLVTGTDFEKGRVNWARCCFVDENRYVQDPYIQLRPGDIVLTKDGTIGKVGYVDTLPRPATLNSGVFVIRPKNGAYDPLFLYHVLRSSIFEAFLTKLQAGSTIAHLYQKDFVGFSFNAPELKEQRAIASVLSDMDAYISSLEHLCDKAEAIKQGMTQALLTGRIRLVKPGAKA